MLKCPLPAACPWPPCGELDAIRDASAHSPCRPHRGRPHRGRHSAEARWPAFRARQVSVQPNSHPSCLLPLTQFLTTLQPLTSLLKLRRSVSAQDMRVPDSLVASGWPASTRGGGGVPIREPGRYTLDVCLSGRGRSVMAGLSAAIPAIPDRRGSMFARSLRWRSQEKHRREWWEGDTISAPRACEHASMRAAASCL